MAKRIVVDPITRIEGHLRIEADIENGVIKDAFSTGTMVRGIEIIRRIETQEMYGLSWDEYVEYALRYILYVQYVLLRMR